MNIGMALPMIQEDVIYNSFEIDIAILEDDQHGVNVSQRMIAAMSAVVVVATFVAIGIAYDIITAMASGAAVSIFLAVLFCEY